MLAPMAIAYIALGSNLGDRESHIGDALARLAAFPGSTLLAVAPLRETEPVDAPLGSRPFLNTAAAIETNLDPPALLRALLQIECDLGRTRSRDGLGRNAPRTIDLDLLLYGDQVIESEELALPHPRMQERPFVLEPLADIAPEALHPLLHKTVRQLLDELPPANARATLDPATSKASIADLPLHS